MHVTSFTSLSLCTVNCSPTGQEAFTCVKHVSKFSNLNNKMHMGGSEIEENVFFFWIVGPIDVEVEDGPPPQIMTHPFHPRYTEIPIVSAMFKYFV